VSRDGGARDAPPPPLQGIRVVDCSLNLAGPFCGQILGDLGADVVKVERPGGGDPSRAWGPPSWGGDGTLFLASNRNKRSVAVALDLPGGREVLARLISGADVVIQAFRPDVAERFGLTWPVLHPRHPRLILCSISAYGADGPLRDRTGYDPLLQAWGGLMSVTGPAGGPPVRVGTSVVDLGAGMWGALGVLAALRSRDATGQGTLVEVSLMDTVLNWVGYHLMGTLATGEVPVPGGSSLGMIAPYGAFPVMGGELMIAAANDGLFRRLCGVLELSGLPDDPRFCTNPLRAQNRAALRTILCEATATWRGEALEEALRGAGVPCSQLRDMGEVARDPAVLGSGALVATPRADLPELTTVALPVKLDGERDPPRYPPPRPGEHTGVILEELGFSPEERAALRAEGAVG